MSNDEAERLFERARALPPEKRAAYLAEACRARPALEAELRSLLDSADAAEDFFARLGEALFASDVGEEGPGPGDVVRQYRIVERIGGGGMGIVYRAHDDRLDRDVALKFLPPHLTPHPWSAERLLSEARAAGALEHPNVCTVHEIGETEDGRAFIAMALYDGPTLRERLREGALPVGEALDIGAQIARGLGAAHARGIVHRDVKPENVIVTSEGIVKLLDFGLAELADATPTRSGVTPGTLAYMSPEQRRAAAVDHRTDLWSLGVVLYEMLAGVHPFRGELDGPALLDGPPLREVRPEVPVAVARIVERLLAEDRSERYGDAAELSRELAAVAIEDASARPVWRTAGALLVAALLVAAAVAGISRLSGRSDAPPDSRPGRTTPASVAAHELYLRGTDQAALRSEAGARQAVQQLEQAVALDSTYAPAWAGLSRMYLVRAYNEDSSTSTGELWVMAEQAVQRALRLDSLLAEGYATRAFVRLFKDYDPVGAEADLGRAIALDPTQALPRQWLTVLYIFTERPHLALDQAELALRSEPLSPSAHAELAHALLANGRYAEALERLERIADVDPPLLRTPALKAHAYLGMGRLDEALETLRPSDDAVDPHRLALYGYVLGRAGRREEAIVVQADVLEGWRDGTLSAHDVALTYAGLGERDEAFRWLDRSVEDRSLLRTHGSMLEPTFAELHADPRFEELRRRLGFGPRPRPGPQNR